jgi:aspartyl-tRNA(Asn)/glutamyl-tRNA(Gln) amidotransferase subunit A
MATGDPRMITPFTALGGPIATIPAGLGPTGMPLGLMLAGPPGRDGALGAAALKVAEIIELPR